MISFTCDVDWAAEAVLADAIALFEKYGIKCTFFSTHHSEVLSKCNKKLFEIALHPNFNPLLQSDSGKSAEDIIDEIIEIHPDAKGVRSHSMFQSTHIMQKYADRRLVYDANHFLPYHSGLKPYKLWNGMVRIPYNWEDDVHWEYGYSFESSRIDLEDPGLNIFDFHPIHIYLNTENKFRYKEAKKYSLAPDKLLTYRNNEVPGTRDLLISLLKYCKVNRRETFKLIEITRQVL
jgi:hypothetical protein